MGDYRLFIIFTKKIMATGKFKLKTNNEFNAIYYRFKQGNQFDFTVSTGIKIPNGRWSESKEEVLSTIHVNFRDINIKLKEFDTYIMKEYESSKLADDTIIINSKWLKKNIDTFFRRQSSDQETNNSLFFTHFIENFISESKTRRTKKNTLLKPRTIQHYQTTLNKINDFEKHIGKKISLDKINIEFHTHFVYFLENIDCLNQNTIGGYIDDIKLFCRNAELKGIKISNEYKLQQFYSPTNSTLDTYLNEEEITKINNLHFTQDYLDNARDWLIIGLRTGLRVSDLLCLTKKEIVNDFIELRNKKTDFPVIIPIHNDVVKILAKRNGSFPRKISDPNFNLYIKEVGKIAELTELIEGGKISEVKIKRKNKEEIIHRKIIGLYPKHELISSHICRRTFATLLYGKVDTLTIMKITGHQTEKQFLNYIKITPREYAEKLREYWKSINPTSF